MKSESLRIVAALREVGLEVESVYDLVNSASPYPSAIPILIDQLEKGISDHDNLREGVVRALSVKEARGFAARPLLSEFKKTPVEKSLIRWAIANAIAVTMTEAELDDVLAVVSDAGNGIARQMLVLRLGDFRGKREVESTLIRLLQEADVVIQSIRALDKLRSKRALPLVLELAQHGPAPVRKVAKQYRELREMGRG